MEPLLPWLPPFARACVGFVAFVPPTSIHDEAGGRAFLVALHRCAKLARQDDLVDLERTHVVLAECRRNVQLPHLAATNAALGEFMRDKTFHLMVMVVVGTTPHVVVTWLRALKLPPNLTTPVFKFVSDFVAKMRSRQDVLCDIPMVLRDVQRAMVRAQTQLALHASLASASFLLGVPQSVRIACLLATRLLDETDGAEATRMLPARACLSVPRDHAKVRDVEWLLRAMPEHVEGCEAERTYATVVFGDASRPCLRDAMSFSLAGWAQRQGSYRTASRAALCELRIRQARNQLRFTREDMLRVVIECFRRDRAGPPPVPPPPHARAADENEPPPPPTPAHSPLAP